jgi:hypothetical protein
MSDVWFAEPAKDDNTFATRGEGAFSWLNRSTTERAKACRRFLNENISKLPPDWQPKLHHDLKTQDWHSTFFELLVARTLQILGASISVEVPLEGSNSRPDFVAWFPDATIIVEATLPKANEAINEHSRRNEALVEVIEPLVPEGWSCAVWRLPRLGPNDSKKSFRRALKGVFESLTPESPREEFEITLELDAGEVGLRLIPGRKGARAVITGGIAYGMDDTEIKIRKAVERKKQQVRKASLPVLLAIGTQPLGGDLEDFDMALFGRTCERLGHFRETVEVGFDPSGLFAQRRAEPPTYAGVLAFRDVGWRNVPDPILYLHSRFNGQLPEAINRLGRRTYQEGVGVCIRPAEINNLLHQMDFVPGNV